jgi:hypothetical protein
MPDQAAIRQGLLSWGFLKKLIGLSIPIIPTKDTQGVVQYYYTMHAEKTKALSSFCERRLSSFIAIAEKHIETKRFLETQD